MGESTRGFALARLEPSPDPAADPYQRPHPGSVLADGDTDDYNPLRLNDFVRREASAEGRGATIQYLVCWKGVGVLLGTSGHLSLEGWIISCGGCHFRWSPQIINVLWNCTV